MTAWPTKTEVCANCTVSSIRYSYGARGYCVRCYRLVRRIADVEAWDRARPESLKHIPENGMCEMKDGCRNTICLVTDSYNDGEFSRYQNRTIEQLKRRLLLFRDREGVRRHEAEVTPLMLEEKFGELLRFVRRRATYPSHATYLGLHFNETQRRIIYALLEEIIEQAPWRGLDPGALYSGLRDP